MQHTWKAIMTENNTVDNKEDALTELQIKR